jgi:hypothetical protein
VVARQAHAATIDGIVAIDVGPGMAEPCMVHIQYEGLSPFRLPTVQQADRRFPPAPERHIGEDGFYCLWLPQTAPTDFHKTDGFRLFFDRLHLFLEKQFAFDDRKRRGMAPFWPGPDWQHGGAGHSQWLEEYCETVPIGALHSLLLAAMRPPGERGPCLCGSRRPLAMCHGPWVGRLRKVTKDNAHAAHAVYVKLKDIDVPTTA